MRFNALHDLPFILPSAPNGLRTALDAVARQEHITLTPVIEADSLPLQKSLVAQERLYTVLPLHAVWTEVAEGLVRAVSAVASRIVAIVAEMATKGMWRSGAAK